ncbi:fibronectin type III domain-containing protein [Catenulispora sp. NF23]|uniref:fibronectin type III domain-containing protein n=1 Tax=Catenulispora pinistramenti TaxID=2705254 RepID=UPI001BA85B48|nr:fibronectin type III domain-containing protein [Catenulispora pinistramenti]MBS2532603.1 fibronectin type III domain-containing protein [Catenulispora pinistramenti]
MSTTGFQPQTQAQTPTRVWGARDGHIEFVLRDLIDHPEFAWPRTLLSYPVRWETPSVRAGDLRLTDENGEPVPFQLSQNTKSTTFLTTATVHFFAELGPGRNRRFTLSTRAELPLAESPLPVSVSKAEDGIELDSGVLRVRLPGTRIPFSGDDPVPGPITHFDRGSGWIGTSTLSGTVKSLKCRVLEAGPLFASCEVSYRFTDGAHYTAVVRALSGCDFIELSEAMSDGLDACWDLAWTGLSPTHRFSSSWPHEQAHAWRGIADPIVLGGGGEDPNFSGPGGTEDPSVDMMFTVGPYAPSFAWDIRPHAAFWDERSGDACGVFIRDHAQWDDRLYALWASSHQLQLHFRHTDGVLHWTWPLRPGTRATGIAFYSHERDLEALRRQENGIDAHFQSTYARDLHHWQGTLSLDRVKDWRLEYDGARPDPVATEGEFATAEDFLKAFFEGDEGPRLIARGVNEVGGYLNILQRPLYDRFLDGYDRHRESLSAEDRRRVEALLMLCAYVSANEEMTPLLRMFGGHPNFNADGVAALGALAWAFPDHPDAPVWKDRFEKVAELLGQTFTRPALNGYESAGGRWTESIATYTWAFLRPITLGNALARRSDGHNRLTTPEYAALGRWLVDALTTPIATPEGPMRMHPTQGAHAFWPRRSPIDLRRLADALRNYEPLLAEHLIWGSDENAKGLDVRPGMPDPWRPLVETVGNSGTNPRLRSSKYTGYGITLRADFSQDSEVAVFLEQVDHGPNYRWGIADDNGSGHIYYYAEGRAWSGHGPEDAGDRRVPDATFTTACGVWKDGAFRAIGQNVLERPFYDLGWAQYAEIVPHPDGPVAEEYKSRSVLLMGSDYIAVHDAFAPKQRVVWTWSTLAAATGHDANSFAELPDRMPAVHMLSGVPFVDEIRTSTSQIRRWEGMDTDVLAVVSHRGDLAADARPWGGRIRGPHGVDHVFGAGETDYAADGLRFTGTVGAIRVGDDGHTRLALFHGSAIGAGDVLLSTDDPELGISLEFADPAHITGVFFTRTETTAKLWIGTGLGAGSLFVDGVAPMMTRIGDTELLISLPAGRHVLEFTQGLPRPLPPRVLRTANSSESAIIEFEHVQAAESYVIQLSKDGGNRWETAGSARQSPFTLHGLANGTKYHVRVVAGNSDQTSEPGPDYPCYVDNQRPPAPDGLRLRLGAGHVDATWGEVLGASRYRLYRRLKGDLGYREVFSGLAFEFRDTEPDTDHVYEYAVAAENGNGTGPESTPIDTDATSWRFWEPPVRVGGQGPGFRRRHAYNQPPYTPNPIAPETYGEASCANGS